MGETLSWECFLDLWKLLEDRFDVEHSSRVTKRYFEYLEERTTDEEFRATCMQVFAVGDWFPRPIDLLPDRSPSDIAAFMSALEGSLPERSAAVRQMSREGREAFRRIGGWPGVRGLSPAEARRAYLVEHHQVQQDRAVRIIEHFPGEGT